jgi:hypothetical protein
MKNNIIRWAASAAFLFVMAAGQECIAQATTNHVYHVNTQYMVAGLDSVQRAERNAVLMEYFEKVEMKNPLILHSWTMGHFFTDDSRELVTVYEFADFVDIEKAYDKSDELARLAWPDAAKRAEFMKKMNSYFTHHKDGIFSDLPKLKK